MADQKLTVKDALGQTIMAGDTVAYVKRMGSSVRIKERRVYLALDAKHIKLFEPGLDVPSSAWCKASNMVVIPKQGTEMAE